MRKLFLVSAAALVLCLTGCGTAQAPITPTVAEPVQTVTQAPIVEPTTQPVALTKDQRSWLEFNFMVGTSTEKTMKASYCGSADSMEFGAEFVAPYKKGLTKDQVLSWITEWCDS